MKLVLLPGGQVITMAFPVRLSIRDLKVLMAPELQVPAEVLRVSVEGTMSHFLSWLSLCLSLCPAPTFARHSHPAVPLPLFLRWPVRGAADPA